MQFDWKSKAESIVVAIRRHLHGALRSVVPVVPLLVSRDEFVAPLSSPYDAFHRSFSFAWNEP
jgi:hypothetical protein